MNNYRASNEIFCFYNSKSERARESEREIKGIKKRKKKTICNTIIVINIIFINNSPTTHFMFLTTTTNNHIAIFSDEHESR